MGVNSNELQWRHNGQVVSEMNHLKVRVGLRAVWCLACCSRAHSLCPSAQELSGFKPSGVEVEAFEPQPQADEVGEGGGTGAGAGAFVLVVRVNKDDKDRVEIEVDPVRRVPPPRFSPPPSPSALRVIVLHLDTQRGTADPPLVRARGQVLRAAGSVARQGQVQRRRRRPLGRERQRTGR